MRMATHYEAQPGNGGRSGTNPAWSGSPRPRKLRLLGWLPDARVLASRPRADRMLYLTFDDGPNPEHTPPLLDLLAGHGIRATFFLIGERAGRHPEIVRRIVAGGHRLGNHSWSHPDFDGIGAAARREEIERTDRLLHGFDGLERHDFRPPRGAAPPSLLLDCLLRGPRLAYWSYDSLDYSHRDPEELVANAVRDPVRPGDVILMHDDSAHSRVMLEALVPRWKADGYAFDVLPTRARAARGGDPAGGPSMGARE